MDFEEKTVESEYIYRGKIINLRKDIVKLYNGRTSVREIVEHKGGVGIVAVNEKGKIILVKQYRKPYDEAIIEIPAGKLELGEEPSVCASRELEEETGYVPVKLDLLTIMYPSPGFTNEKLHIYYCSEMKKGTLHPDEDENLEIMYVDFKAAVDMINNGEIKDAKTIAGILLAKELI
jgi:ADP-ribose pyrophosphatase